MPKLVNHLNLNQNELRNAAIQVLNADPGAAVAGQVYFNSVTQRLRQYTGSVWQDYIIASDLTSYASQSYVDTAVSNAVAGLAWKDSVRVASTGNLTLSGTQTVDGVALSAADRILVKDQTTGSQNGIYAVAAGAWSRTSDADTAAKLAGAAVFVEQGTANGDKLFTLTTDNITLNTTSLSWTQFSTGASGTLNKYSSATHGAGTSISIPYATHNIGGGTNQLDVVVLEVSSGDKVWPDVNVGSGGNVTVSFSSSVAANSYRVTITG